MSALFVFLDLLLGKLPWSKFAKDKEKAAVLDLKNKVNVQPMGGGCDWSFTKTHRLSTSLSLTPVHVIT